MKERDWDKFFELLSMIIQGETGQSWKEKAEEVRSRAEEEGKTTDLEEFVMWLSDEE